MKLCVIGRENCSYTQMVAYHLRRHNLSFDLLLETSPTVHSPAPAMLNRILAVYRALNAGRFKALPKWSLFCLKAFLLERLYYRSSSARKILAPYKDVVLHGWKIPHINHVRALNLIKENQFDIGIFADVGIVDGIIIEAFQGFCLNAHPAPLPECRGGGALINTLNQRLAPSASVHFATAGVDEGEIVTVKKLKLHPDDSFNSITLRLSELCAVILADVVGDVVAGNTLERMPNNGELHCWKDCTLDRQRDAERYLKFLLKQG